MLTAPHSHCLNESRRKQKWMKIPLFTSMFNTSETCKKTKEREILNFHRYVKVSEKYFYW